jgi:purine-binding chemotaxis protein CheW
VINLRGNIIPIIDLRKRLKLADSKDLQQKDTWIVILDINSRVTGFIVDHVTRVIKIPLQLIQPPPEMVSSDLKSDYINGVCKLDEHQLLAILDFNRILLVDEFKKLSQIKRHGKI